MQSHPAADVMLLLDSYMYYVPVSMYQHLLVVKTIENSKLGFNSLTVTRLYESVL